MNKTDGHVADVKDDTSKSSPDDPDKQLADAQTETQGVETQNQLVLHGPKLWLLLAVLYMGIYLLSLELTMLATVIPTLTNEFGTVADISWYEAAYVLPL